MSVIQKKTTVAAASVNENVLSGSAFEFARGNVLVSIGVIANDPEALVTIQSGSDIVLEESVCRNEATGRYPIIPDEFYYSDVATMGDRLVVRVRNPKASGDIDFYTIVQVTNL